LDIESEDAKAVPTPSSQSQQQLQPWLTTFVLLIGLLSLMQLLNLLGPVLQATAIKFKSKHLTVYQLPFFNI
jgi:hypothetical protein